MKKEWQAKPLGEVCDCFTGLWKGKKPPFTRVDVIRNTNFTKEGVLDYSDIACLDVEARQFSSRRLQYGDIILEKSGGGPKQPVGRVALFDRSTGEFSFSNFTSALRVRDPHVLDFFFLHKFLYFTYASGITEQMQTHSTGIRNLDFGAYKGIEVPLPPLSEQRRIVGILDEAFAAIAAARANTEKNLQNARALFESHLNTVFSQKGDGWVETTVGAEIEFLAGFAFKSTRYTESDTSVRLLRGDNIIQGCLRWDDVKKWPAAETSEYERYQLCSGDVVLAMDRPWVKAGLKRAMITDDDLPCLLVQRTARLRVKPRLDSRYLYYLIGSAGFIEHILGAQTGSGVPHISGQQIMDFRFPRPSIEEQTNIADNLDRLSTETRRLEGLYARKLEVLTALKQSLLHAAFSGEL